jgi:hypothetical protein
MTHNKNMCLHHVYSESTGTATRGAAGLGVFTPLRWLASLTLSESLGQQFSEVRDWLLGNDFEVEVYDEDEGPTYFGDFVTTSASLRDDVTPPHLTTLHGCLRVLVYISVDHVSFDITFDAFPPHRLATTKPFCHYVHFLPDHRVTTPPQGGARGGELLKLLPQQRR